MSAVIAASICVPALIALYLLKLRRRPVRVSTLLFWTRAAEDLQANVPLRMLRASWLLLLHLLILGLLIVALGRPATSAEGAAPARSVILIDRSASMRASDGRDGTRLDEARARALRLAAEATRAGGVAAVVEFALEPRVLAPFTSSRGALDDAIRGLTPTDQPADLARALRLAEALGVSEDESEVPPVIFLVSDGGLARAAVESAPGEVRLVRVGPAPEEARDNMGFVALAARRDADDPAIVRIFTRLQNAGAPAAAPLALSLNGEVVERRIVEVPGATEAGPGEAALAFQLFAPAGGVAMLTNARPDRLEADNAAAIVLRAPSRPRVLLVSPAPGAQEAEGDAPADWVLPEVLDEMGLGAVRRARAPEAERFLREGSIAEFDLVIYDRVTPSAPAPIPTISFGIEPRAIGIDAATDAAAGAAGPTYVLSWRRAHPVLRDAPLDAVLVARSIRAEPGRGVIDLARGRSGSLMLLSDEGVKRLAVCFDLADSNWPLQVSFPIFLANAVEHLTQSAGEAGRMFTTGELISLAAAPGATEVVLRGPAVLRAPTGIAGAALLGFTELAGVYTVEGGVEPAAAVNLLDAGESLLATADEVSIGGRTVRSHESEGSRELWHFFVLGAVLLLAVEWLAYAARARV